MAVYGLLGKTLSHSYSPRLHKLLGGYDYALFERTETALPSFLRSSSFDGLNVTIPYKKAVIPFCAALSDDARRIGSVNTVVRRADGSLFGDNTDLFGFLYMLRRSEIDVRGKKALIFGSGGACATVRTALSDLGAREIVVISRSGENNYQNLSCHFDAQILVNTTPLGMYPHTGVFAADPALFPRCTGVLDVVYNPARTALLLRAEELGIPCAGGLSMLVAQAARSSERFTGVPISDAQIDAACDTLRRSMRNIILIGMPGCGKTTTGERLAALLGRPFFDCDAAVEARCGASIPSLFASHGEDWFRTQESAALRELGQHSGAVIATGGGCVLRPENYASLHQNGVIFWLQRELSLLARDGRPLSEHCDLNAMFALRRPLYQRFCDGVIDNNATPADTCEHIVSSLERI